MREKKQAPEAPTGARQTGFREEQGERGSSRRVSRETNRGGEKRDRRSPVSFYLLILFAAAFLLLLLAYFVQQRNSSAAPASPPAGPVWTAGPRAPSPLAENFDQIG